MRIRRSPETESLGLSGLSGSVTGVTTPTVTNVDVIGNLRDDYALAVTFEESGETYWFARELVEFVDHAPGTEIQISGAPFKSVRTDAGEWQDVPLTAAEREQDGLRRKPGGERDTRRRIMVSLIAMAAGWASGYAYYAAYMTCCTTWRRSTDDAAILFWSAAFVSLGWCLVTLPVVLTRRLDVLWSRPFAALFFGAVTGGLTFAFLLIWTPLAKSPFYISYAAVVGGIAGLVFSIAQHGARGAAARQWFRD